MFGIGITEIVLILIVALVIVGPEKLPELVKTIAKGFNEFKRTTNDLKRSIEWNPDSSRRGYRSSESGPLKEDEEKVVDEQKENAGEVEDEPLVESVKPQKRASKKPATGKRATVGKSASKKAPAKKKTVRKRATKKSVKRTVGEGSD